MRDAFIARLTAHAVADPRIMLVTGDLGFVVLDEFRARCPQQFVNVGVAEQNMMGVATGLALEGRIVFVYSIANFATLRCLEQLRNDAAYHNANVKVVAIGGGFSYGALGMSHHATEDLAAIRAIPELTCIAPGTDEEVGDAVDAIVARQGAAYLRLDRDAAPSQGVEPFRLGVPRVLRDGQHAALLAVGGVVSEALAAADQLAREGIEVRVVSVHTLRPLDAQALAALCRDVPAVLTVEEHMIEGGLGGATAEVLLEHNAAPRIFRRLGVRDRFTSEVGSQQFLRTRNGLDAASIAHAVRSAIAAAQDAPTHEPPVGSAT